MDRNKKRVTYITGANATLGAYGLSESKKKNEQRNQCCSVLVFLFSYDTIREQCLQLPEVLIFHIFQYRGSPSTALRIRAATSAGEMDKRYRTSPTS